MITLFKKASVKWTVVTLITLTLTAGCSSLVIPTSHSSSISPANPNANNIPKQDVASTDMPASKSTADNSTSSASITPKQDASQNASKSIVYKNAEYGFNFTLPESWNGYTIVTGKWKESTSGDLPDNETAQTGPMISIRHPLWTSENPRQDIPIMIFTPTQWSLLQQDKFHIGAAPIGPSELGHNSRYVFALPARYNFAFPTGFEEVETILDSNPLQPTKR